MLTNSLLAFDKCASVADDFGAGDSVAVDFALSELAKLPLTRLISYARANLISYKIKALDAPCSASTHFAQAVLAVAKLEQHSLVLTAAEEHQLIWLAMQLCEYTSLCQTGLAFAIDEQKLLDAA